MCGIVGYYGKNTTSVQIKKMLELSSHRGTSNTSYNIYKKSVLGINRLAIVDLENGNQPLHNEEQNVHLVGNGFIYNYTAIMDDLENSGCKFQTRNDFQVLTHLYELYGSDLVQHIDGMFAFLLYDEKNDTFIAGRDPIGKKPLYYIEENDNWFFASEAKSFLVNGLDVKNVQELLPGHFLMPSKDKRPVQYYRFPKARKVAKKETVRELLDAAVKKRLRADVEVGTFLSGGLDSSIVTALANQYHPRLKAITVGIEGSPDLVNAKKVAEHLGVEHAVCDFTTNDLIEILPKMVWHLESYNPSAINCAAVNYLAAKKAKEMGLTVVLCGEGADEIFGGYLVLRHLKTAEFIRASWKMIGNIFKTECKRLDRSTMAATLEARCPFLDRDVVEYAINLPKSSKIKETQTRKIEKFILREAFEDLLPKEVLWREKEPFDQGSGGRCIISWINDQVTDTEVHDLQKSYPNAGINSKEIAFYFNIFRKKFGHLGGKNVFDMFGDYPIMQHNITQRTATSGS